MNKISPKNHLGASLPPANSRYAGRLNRKHAPRFEGHTSDEAPTAKRKSYHKGISSEFNTDNSKTEASCQDKWRSKRERKEKRRYKHRRKHSIDEAKKIPRFGTNFRLCALVLTHMWVQRTKSQDKEWCHSHRQKWQWQSPSSSSATSSSCMNITGMVHEEDFSLALWWNIAKGREYYLLWHKIKKCCACGYYQVSEVHQAEPFAKHLRHEGHL